MNTAQEIRDVVSSGMDKAIEQGFELAKLQIQQYLLRRVEWLKKEAHSGGNFDLLIQRADESAYIESVVRVMTAPKTNH